MLIGIRSKARLKSFLAKIWNWKVSLKNVRLQFSSDCGKILMNVCSKLLEKSPLKYRLTTQISCLSSGDKCSRQFDKLLSDDSNGMGRAKWRLASLSTRTSYAQTFSSEQLRTSGWSTMKFTDMELLNSTIRSNWRGEGKSRIAIWYTAYIYIFFCGVMSLLYDI